MINFYLSCKFFTLTINFSEVVLHRQIPLYITIFGKKRLRNVFNTSRRPFNKNSLTWWYVLKTSWRYLCKTSWRRLEEVWPRRIYLSSLRRLEDAFWRRKAKVSIFVLTKMSWRCLLKMKTKDVFIKTNVCWD